MCYYNRSKVLKLSKEKKIVELDSKAHFNRRHLKESHLHETLTSSRKVEHGIGLRPSSQFTKKESQTDSLSDVLTFGYLLVYLL